MFRPAKQINRYIYIHFIVSCLILVVSLVYIMIEYSAKYRCVYSRHLICCADIYGIFTHLISLISYYDLFLDYSVSSSVSVTNSVSFINVVGHIYL